MQSPTMVDKVSITICGDGGCGTFSRDSSTNWWTSPSAQLTSSTGKSSITLRLVRSQWTSDYDPTIEDSYSVTRAVDGLNYHLSLTDTAGQEEYRSLWAASNLHSDAFLLVYDITNTHSLEGLSWFLDMIDIETENRIEENNRLLRDKGNKVRGNRDAGWRIPPIKIIAGNKCDLKEARIVSSKMGLDWAKSKGCGFMETSARDMVNIEETFACELFLLSSFDRY
jgi:GTPase KRas